MFACIYIPDFPVEAMVRSQPLLREHAVAVLEGKSPMVRVIALNEKARLMGMETGMTKLQAAMFAGEEKSVRQASGNPSSRHTMDRAILRQRSSEQEGSAHAALLDVAHAFAPRVEDTADDTLLLDLVGLERLYGSSAKMGRDLATRVMAVGVEGNIAIASNPNAALHAARGFNGTTVIPAGKEAERLGVLPLPVLLDAFQISTNKKVSGKAAEREHEKLREQMLDTLERWGVRDFRTLARLPEHALASRLGEAGTQLRLMACGAGMRTLALCEPLLRFEEAMELESAVETLEPLSFLLNRLLEQLCVRLEARALAVQELCLRLQLERRVADEETTTLQELNAAPASHTVGGKPVLERTLRLPLSMRDSKVFLKLLQLELAAHPPGAPVSKIWVAAESAPPRSAQHGLFLPVTPEAEKLEITLARINGVVGERRAGIARLLDSHRRGSFRMERFSTTTEGPNKSTTMSDISGHPPLALRVFRPARQLQVRVAEGRPTNLVPDTNSSDRGTLHGKVVWSAGPWRSSGDWWMENATDESVPKQCPGHWDREEWDIAVVNGNRLAQEQFDSFALYRIYRDLATGHWFADASYD
jgi:protein ImuB